MKKNGMKRNGMKRLLAYPLVIALMLSVAFTPGASVAAKEKAAAKPVTLNIRIMNEFRNIEAVTAEFEKRVADDPILSNIRLNFSYIPGGDYRDRITMLMSAQDEDIDLMFCGAWHGLDNFARSGMLADLTDYFNNPEYPGLQKGFQEDFINAVKIYVEDEDGNLDARLFSIPLAEAFNDMRGITYREDLRVKYDIPEITDDDIFEQYMQTVLENEPSITRGWDAYNGFFYAFSTWYSGMHDNVFPIEIIGQETPIFVGLNSDGTEVLNAVVMGDTQENFDKMPEGYQYDFIKEYHLNRLRWVPYLSPARGTTDEMSGFAAGSYGVVSGIINSRKDLLNDEQVLDIWPEASIRLYITEADQRNLVEGAIVNEMKSNNFLVVPEWSKNIDITMRFLDWMYGSQENHDLFQFGLEGVHWEAVGDDAYRTIELAEGDKYIMPGYSFTWNPNYIRYTEEVTQDAEIKAMYDYQNSLDAYTVSPISGFAFNSENVTTQIANVSALSNELMLRFAVDGDKTESVIDQWYSDAADIGLDEVKDELIRQLQQFLDLIN